MAIVPLRECRTPILTANALLDETDTNIKLVRIRYNLFIFILYSGKKPQFLCLIIYPKQEDIQDIKNISYIYRATFEFRQF